jgi:hypothetical protein
MPNKVARREATMNRAMGVCKGVRRKTVNSLYTATLASHVKTTIKSSTSSILKVISLAAVCPIITCGEKSMVTRRI